MIILKDLMAKKYHLPKDIVKHYKVIVNRMNFYDHLIDYNIKQYEEIRKLTKVRGEDRITTGCLLDCKYIKNHYRLTVVDLSRKRELDANQKVIQKIEFVGQIKNSNGEDTDCPQSMLFLTILGKLKEARLKFPRGSVTVL